MKRLLMALLVACSLASAETTPNLLTNQWTGVVSGANGGYSGGPGPAYNAGTDTIIFSWGQYTASQSIAINNALRGTGVRVGGYNYSWDVNNNDLNTGTIVGNVALRNQAGTVVQNYAYDYSNIRTTGLAENFQRFSGTQNFSDVYALADLSTITLSWTGRDDRFWAGYYGPRVRNQSLSLNYTVDPCVANPAYSPSCPNYGTVNYSNNLVPNPTGYAVQGSSIDQTYAINQALGLSGAGVMIHGFQWGYVANANGPYCAFWLIVCLDDRLPSVTTNVNITDNAGSSLYAVSRTYTNSYNTTDYSYLFPSSRNLLTLGDFNYTATTNDAAYVGSMWSRALYTPDPCVVNPLSSTSCPGYAQAYLDMQCNAYPLYSTQCPGYAQAYFTQQCTASALYNPACPGYAAAYLSYQCSINPLYATQCPGYEQAYFNQQCSINPLYNNQCPGYAQAYFDQQCNLNGLYSTQCPNYAEAYAKKMVLERQGMASVVATAGVVAATAPTAATVADDGTVSTTTSTGNATVDKVTSTPTTATTSAAAPAAPVQLVQPQQPPAATAAAPVEKKPEPQGGQGPQQSQGPSGEKPQPSARQQLAERRAEAAKKDAVEKGKNLANEMGKAADMESQKAVQNVVIQAMGHTPGFDTYSKSSIPDVIGYKPYTVYSNQVNVDNRRLGQALYGPSDRLHNDLVNSQYKGN